ncbi:hypothetical protein ACT02E_23725, partial [Enterobacter asburiae]
PRLSLSGALNGQFAIPSLQARSATCRDCGSHNSNDPLAFDLQGGRLDKVVLDGDEAGREIY